MLYRGMKVDQGLAGKPQCGESGSTLGVRVPDDIPVREGRVAPLTGGMSVVCEHWEMLPGHRKPKTHGGVAKGYMVFSIDENDLPPTLIARQDKPVEFPEHRAVEPAAECGIEEYRRNLHSTQEHWNVMP